MRSTQTNKVVLLSGATGFLGKVVLFELIRRREELGLDRVLLLIRKKRDVSTLDRFKKDIRDSRCFANLDPEWVNCVDAVDCDLEEAGMGLSTAKQRFLAERITHIIHCAASVDFELPLPLAASSNITASLNVLGFAKKCKNLQSMVSVSTAYVTPHSGKDEPIIPKLVPLPEDPVKIYNNLVLGSERLEALVKRSGHPNSYTFTKCVAEHLLVRYREDVPLRIVRPSIISASELYPERGWLDSKAAFAGFVALVGAGRLNILRANPTTRLDIVPCDWVATRVVDSAFAGAPAGTEVPISHAVMGANNSCTVQRCADIVLDYFEDQNVDKRPGLYYIGKNFVRAWSYDLCLHRIPGAMSALVLRVMGDKRQLSRLKRLRDAQSYLLRAFYYFTTHTFDFVDTERETDGDYDSADYILVVAQGVARNILKSEPRGASPFPSF